MNIRENRYKIEKIEKYNEELSVLNKKSVLSSVSIGCISGAIMLLVCYGCNISDLLSKIESYCLAGGGVVLDIFMIKTTVNLLVSKTLLEDKLNQINDQSNDIIKEDNKRSR